MQQQVQRQEQTQIPFGNDKQKWLGDGFGDEGFGFGLDLGEVVGA